MNKRIGGFRVRKYFVVAIIIPLFSLLHSCKEDTGGIGANILPKSDLIYASETDTCSVLSSMVLKDSVQTNGANNCMLGSYSDPVFGQVKASIYTLVSSQVGTITIPWDSTGAPSVDSAVLILPFYNLGTATNYGNLDPQMVIVDTLESTLVSGKAYYSDTSIQYAPTPIGQKQVTPNPLNDTIRIRLNKSWTNYVVSQMNANSSYYYPSFSSLVKGLYITVSNPLQLPGQGGIWYINLENSFAGIYIYYHGTTVTVPAQPEYYIDFPVGGAWFTHIDKDYSTAAFSNALPVGKVDSISANDLVYVQSMGGVLGKITFPNLRKNWAKIGPVVVNEAEVDLPADAHYNQIPFICPAGLYLAAINSAGGPDQSQSYLGNYNGFNNMYTLYINQYIQEVIDGKDTDRGLYIIPLNQATTANRVVLYGARHDELPTNQKIKLKIYYTPLKPN